MTDSEQRLLEVLRPLDPRKELPSFERTPSGYVRVIWSDGSEGWVCDGLRDLALEMALRVQRFRGRTTPNGDAIICSRAERDAIVSGLRAWLRENAS